MKIVFFRQQMTYFLFIGTFSVYLGEQLFNLFKTIQFCIRQMPATEHDACIQIMIHGSWYDIFIGCVATAFSILMLLTLKKPEKKIVS